MVNFVGWCFVNIVRFKFVNFRFVRVGEVNYGLWRNVDDVNIDIDF